jgi:hypothetical protein
MLAFAQALVKTNGAWDFLKGGQSARTRALSQVEVQCRNTTINCLVSL